MNRIVRQRQRGFTLIELMIVVVILGVLSAVAIPAFLKFVRKSKTSEGPINIKAIANGAETWYGANHTYANTGHPMRRHFPHDGNNSQVKNGPTTNRRPTEKHCKGGFAQYKKDVTQWDVNPWKRLKFAIGKAHYFQYYYTYNNSDAKSPSFTVRASADLDCDEHLSSYTLSGKANAATGEVERFNMIVTDALE